MREGWVRLISNRWICKRWIRKRWILKRWIRKRWIRKRWIRKRWIRERCFSKRSIVMYEMIHGSIFWWISFRSRITIFSSGGQIFRYKISAQHAQLVFPFPHMPKSDVFTQGLAKIEKKTTTLQIISQKIKKNISNWNGSIYLLCNGIHGHNPFEFQHGKRIMCVLIVIWIRELGIVGERYVSLPCRTMIYDVCYEPIYCDPPNRSAQKQRSESGNE